MSERALRALLAGALVFAGPLAAQGPSAAALRAESRALRREADSVARAERERTPVLVRVALPGGWTAMVSPQLVRTAPLELGQALAQLRDTFGVALLPDTLTVLVVADTSGYQSVRIQVGGATSFHWGERLPLRRGTLRGEAVGAGLASVQRQSDSAFRAWAGATPFDGNFDLRARMELGTTAGPDVAACRGGDASRCLMALGLTPGHPGSLGIASRASLFRFAFSKRAGESPLARFYADSATPLPERLGSLAGMAPDRLVGEWRTMVLAAGNTRTGDIAASLAGALILAGLGLRGIRRRSV